MQVSRSKLQDELQRRVGAGHSNGASGSERGAGSTLQLSIGSTIIVLSTSSWRMTDEDYRVRSVSVISILIVPRC